MCIELILLGQTLIFVSQKADQIKETDPYGIGMVIIAMGTVFLSLTFLYLIFKYLGRAYNIDIKKRILIRKGKYEEAGQLKEITSGEVNVAIALAIHLYTSQLHDIESSKLTIQRVAKTYSPWSSKIYGLRKDPR
ncbi:MAG: OadG family protein [Bacteroidales bacterium]|nr:OadG family protein [Bacteroidales bacterium]